jgi:hypothetical protein
MISQADLFDKATSYEGLARAEGDETRKKVWLLLRDMWIALANESATISEEKLAMEVAEAVEQIHQTLQRENARSKRAGGTRASLDSDTGSAC